MKILHVYKDYYPVLGGIENYIKMLAETQAKQGLKVTALVTAPGRKTIVERVNGVEVIKAGRLATMASTPLSAALFVWMRRLKADIVHLHFPHPPGEVANLWLGRGQRTVITYHSDIIRQKRLLQLYKPLLWRVLSQAHRLIATSPPYIRSSPYLSRVAEKCVVIPLGIEVQRFESADQEAVERLRKRYRPPLLLFVGRLRYYKGLQYLIQAMKEVEAQLLIVGSGPMLEDWRQLSESLSLEERVIFLGEVEDEQLPCYYHACDLFVLPACERSEAFGAVQLEAMAAAKAVICTELGTGTSYVNRHGQTGLVVPPGDVSALVEASRTLLADEELRRRMGEQGRQRVRASFSKEIMAHRVLRLYEEVLDEQS